MTNLDPETEELIEHGTPDWAVAPGEIIEEALQSRHWTQAELAVRLSVSKKHLNQLIRGKATLSEEMAFKLGQVFVNEADFWLRLERQYRLQLKHKERLAKLAQDIGWLQDIPLEDMIKFYGVQERPHSQGEQIIECLRYFAVADVAAWHKRYQKPIAAYRATDKFKKAPGPIAAWLRYGELEAERQDCAAYDKSTFERILLAARALTQNKSANSWPLELQKLCSSAGVILVLAPAPNGCPVSGACKWLPGNKRALILLSERDKSEGSLWFTFFHEAAHLLLHANKLLFLDAFDEESMAEKEENEANRWARDFLIPCPEYAAFLEGQNFSSPAIESFALSVGVSAAIVIGRLQHDKKVPSGLPAI